MEQMVAAWLRSAPLSLAVVKQTDPAQIVERFPLSDFL
jgi:hypothetical protein